MKGALLLASFDSMALEALKSNSPSAAGIEVLSDAPSPCRWARREPRIPFFAPIGSQRSTHLLAKERLRTAVVAVVGEVVDGAPAPFEKGRPPAAALTGLCGLCSARCELKAEGPLRAAMFLSLEERSRRRA